MKSYSLPFCKILIAALLITLLSSCGPLVDPEVITSVPSDVTLTSAIAGGEIVVDGRTKVTARGVCWREEASPSLSDPHTDEGSGIGTFESEITGLSESTVYHVRAYATTELGTVYGPVVEFVTCLEDYDGNVYRAVKIGEQVWMAENLRVTHYRYGEAIPNVTENVDWRSLIDNAGDWPGGVPPERFDAYATYSTDESYIETYGLLYNWWTTSLDDVAPISEDSVYHNPIAPEGWHVPSDDEWKILEMYLGMAAQAANYPNGSTGIQFDRGDSEGTMLKSVANAYLPGTDVYGFTALPTGIRFYSGAFQGFDEVAGLPAYHTYLWVTDERDSATSWCRGLSAARTEIGRGPWHNRNGHAIRCVRDEY